MKKVLLFWIIGVISISLFGCGSTGGSDGTPPILFAPASPPPVVQISGPQAQASTANMQARALVGLFEGPIEIVNAALGIAAQVPSENESPTADLSTTWTMQASANVDVSENITITPTGSCKVDIFLEGETVAEDTTTWDIKLGVEGLVPTFTFVSAKSSNSDCLPITWTMTASDTTPKPTAKFNTNGETSTVKISFSFNEIPLVMTIENQEDDSGSVTIDGIYTAQWEADGSTSETFITRELLGINIEEELRAIMYDYFN